VKVEPVLGACREQARRYPCIPSVAQCLADRRCPLAVSKISGPTRRAFEVEMALKYRRGNPLLAETMFGWGRHTGGGGSLRETRRDPLSLGASRLQRHHPWADEQLEVAAALR